ncbi:MAG: DUF4840 domain-containing protein [Prevotella sp.]|jgi:hypothetical protein
MKNLKIITLQLVALLFVGGLFTSCLDDDDDDVSFSYLSKSEQLQAFYQLAGTHSGRVYWLADSSSYTKLDSIDVTLNAANDSTIYIYNFPTKPLAQYVNDGERELKDSLEKQDNVTLTIYTAYFHLSPIYFEADPYNITYNMTYGGESHKVEVAFYTGMPNYLYGEYDSTSSPQLVIRMCQGAIWVDRDTDDTNPTNHMSTSQNFVFQSN